jgi:predicted glycogen debranching enzyme
MLRSHFDKNDLLINENSFEKEYLLTSTTGAYSSSSISGSNTRKYHGLLIVPQPGIDDDNHVLLSSLDETLHYKERSVKLATHKYPGTIYPEGKQFIEEFFLSPIPAWLYRIEDILLSKELLLSEKNTSVYIRYTLIESDGPVRLSLLPLLAFRNIHKLSKANLFIRKKNTESANGINLKLYQNYDPLFMQLSINNEFIPLSDWYYNIEYMRESERGYEYLEDLYSPGFFDIEMNKDDQVIFYAGVSETNPATLKTRFKNEIRHKPLLLNLDDCLENAARQFIIKKNKSAFIKAGYPWFGTWGRDTFISLPGLTLATNQPKIFKAVIDSTRPDLKSGLLPNLGTGRNAVYNSADASLWFIWAIHQYTIFTNTWDDIWGIYGKELTSIVKHYRFGTQHHIHMDDDGLIIQGDKGYALTWMDRVIDGKPVTQRAGKAVDINALWYNAICFCLEAALLAGDKTFFSDWEDLPAKIKNSFMHEFWDDDKGYLADTVNGEQKDWSVRPNQVFAVSMPFSPVSRIHRYEILEKIKSELLTSRGLRTLSQDDPNYHPNYSGNQAERDAAYHQGTVWPWLVGHFCEAYLHEFGEEGITFCENIYKEFEPAINYQCLGNIAEVYDGAYPHNAGGSISQAWNVAELLRIKHMINKVKDRALTELHREQTKA